MVVIAKVFETRDQADVVDERATVVADGEEGVDNDLMDVGIGLNKGFEQVGQGEGIDGGDIEEHQIGEGDRMVSRESGFHLLKSVFGGGVAGGEVEHGGLTGGEIIEGRLASRDGGCEMEAERLQVERTFGAQ